MSLHLDRPEATALLGRRIGRRAPAGLLVRLDGPLGAGKTTLVQGIAEGLEVPPTSQVRSPSFALVRTHEGGRLPLVHVDFYRLSEPDELTELGLDEWLGAQALVAVEWADRFVDSLPAGGLTVRLDYRDDGGRDADLDWSTDLEAGDLVHDLRGKEQDHG